MSVLVNVRMTPEERDGWKAAAAEEGQSMTDFIKSAVAVRMGAVDLSSSGYVSPLRARGFKPDFKGKV